MLRFIFVSLPLLLLFVIALAFGALNKQVIEIDFIFTQATLSMASLSAIFLSLGFVLGALSLFAKLMTVRHENRKLRQQLTKSPVS